MVVTVLLGALVVLGVAYLIALGWSARMRGQYRPSVESVALGAVTNFFDTLGIGSYAPTTAWLRLRKMVPDSYIPTILNAGHGLPTVVQALIYIKLVQVDPKLLIACIAAAVAGAIVGAPVVVRLPVRAIQSVVGVALLIAAALYVLKNLDLMPGGGAALALPPTLFWIAVGGYFVMGALMTAGIGLYGPSLMMLSLMGLNPAACFPIMTGACAFLMPVSGFGFLRSTRIDLKVVLGIALGGIPAVLLAAFIVKSLPLTWIRWGVVVVVLYAAAVMLRAAMRKAPAATGDLIEA